ncbi:MAG: carbon storage regulator CsrA [Halanaerobiales bacterium]|nr:carbon storage regulator CsrA [Halanaerobiales bacterium]
MLILSRKEDEKILIDDDIKISIVEIKGNQVKIGIEAPQDVEILREEVFKSVEKENIQATKERSVGLDQLKNFGNKNKK